MINGSDIMLFKTCSMCPEQYDAKDKNGKTIGYLRLRWGHFAVYCPNADSDNSIYSVKLNHNKGHFISRKERKKHLQKAKFAIAAYWNRISNL